MTQNPLSRGVALFGDYARGVILLGASFSFLVPVCCARKCFKRSWRCVYFAYLSFYMIVLWFSTGGAARSLFCSKFLSFRCYARPVLHDSPCMWREGVSTAFHTLTFDVLSERRPSRSALHAPVVYGIALTPVRSGGEDCFRNSINCIPCVHLPINFPVYVGGSGCLWGGTESSRPSSEILDGDCFGTLARRRNRIQRLQPTQRDILCIL